MVNNQEFVGDEHARIYSAYRPDIPSTIAERSISFLKEKFDGPLGTAVDVGCGSGQSTVILAPHFKHVYGLDASKAQIQEAELKRAHGNIQYFVNDVRVLPFQNGSVQLVTAGASLHWFDREMFFKEVRRVLVHNGVLVAYTYHRVCPVTECPQLTKEVECLYSEIYDILNSYWPEEVQISLDYYKNIEFPFEEVFRAPDIRQTLDGKLSEVVGFVESFSAYQNLKKQNLKKAEELLIYFRDKLQELLGLPTQKNSTIKLYRDFYCIMCRKSD